MKRWFNFGTMLSGMIKNEKITTIFELDKILKEKFGAEESSIEEINKFEMYSLRNETIEEIKKIHKIYKLINKIKPSANDYLEYFLLIELINDKIKNVRQLGKGDKDLDKVWKIIDWC